MTEYQSKTLLDLVALQVAMSDEDMRYQRTKTWSCTRIRSILQDEKPLGPLTYRAEIVCQILSSWLPLHVDQQMVRCNGRTALSYAVQYTREDLVNYLLQERSADPNAVSNEGISTLMYAAKAGCVPIMNALLHHGAQPFLADKDGKQALHYAVESGSLEAVEMILKQPGVDPNVQGGRDNKTPLMLAIRAKNIPMIQTLLVHGADPSIADKHQRQALHYAVKSGSVDTVKTILKERSVDSNARGGLDKMTPFMLAVRSCCLPMIQVLLAHGADVSQVDSYVTYQRCTPVDLSRNNNETLMGPGAFDHSRLTTVYTKQALHYAVESGSLDIVRLLLEQPGADPNAVAGCMNETPLMLAEKAKCQPMIDLLLTYTSKLQQQNSYDQGIVNMVQKLMCRTGSTT